MKRPVEIHPKTTATSFDWNYVTFTCYLSLRDRLKILFGKRSFMTMYASDIAILSNHVIDNDAVYNRVMRQDCGAKMDGGKE